MKPETVAILLASFGLAAASPIARIGHRPIRVLRGREVPQEASHEQFLVTVRASLDTNNPAGIVDPVFGLLGDAAAAGGQGSISNTDCLQQATADQAFTNAKAAGDVNGMTAALIYRALERNTGAVGLASVPCTAITATNPEIAAISQHQDPASTGAAATNKAITLALAMQIASIGGDPQQALKAGTFAPGTIGDPTAAGHTCDTQNDPIGCIFTENLLVEDATPAEVSAAVAGMSAGMAMASTAVASSAAASSAVAAVVTAAPVCSCPAVTAAEAATTTAVSSVVAVAATTASVADTTVAAASECSSTVTVAASTTAAAASSASSTVATGSNVQTFTGALGGIGAPPVIFTAGSDRPFSTDGDTFVNSAAAVQRSCSVQHNECADAANNGTLSGGEQQCETQQTACDAAIVTKKVRRQALSFGSCGNPAIDFGQQDDRPNANAFRAVDQVDYNHGSALNIGVVASFICQRLGSPCDAPAATIAACNSGTTAAEALTGQAAADAFNSALGVSASGVVAAVSSAATAVAASSTSVAVAATSSATVVACT